MRRILCLFLAFCGLMAVLSVPSAAAGKATEVSADAEAVAKSAGQKWALKSLSNGKYVSVEMEDSGKYEWRLRARADSAGAGERFTLHTNHAARTMGLRSASTGFFATAEFSDADDRKGMLRARGGTLGSWQQFQPDFTKLSDGAYQVTFKSVATGHEREYVDVGDDGTLAARSSAPGQRAQFALVPVRGTANDSPPAPRSAPAGALNVMTWNVCANNTNCHWTNRLAGYKELNSQIKGRLKDPQGGGLPDVVLFQEFCEKHAKRVEEMLEESTGRGWNVRFAPIHRREGGPLIQTQCKMAGPEGGKLDRGAYGVALAVPDDNVWYQRFDFTSPSDKEQRTALCAALPSRAVMACTGHLSAGKGYDDEDGSVRRTQAVELRKLADGWAARGYRPVFGGDMNLVPPYPEADVDKGGPSDALNPVYDRYLECDQKSPDAPRTGAPTANGSGGVPTRKLDYLFGPNSASFSRCSVSATSGLSDHWTLYGTLSLPAT
ncbi:endonuclease/exonuclease/phosphatase family protein [Streptomyces iconiensis]|uniref:Endonuclease/exonuclease/phosphatase family protein n=1 Tax=Streptomyces iconiensis TaxID=1384038 RepID=A0ABT6ZZH3_9ACTN|nr:endonuclease/exonuclease/phosphatase family protein [Streptomyces iconiensis]MDJ1134478.1 endonuclease/exonuclease/phosphatase family protein [Streptomyces iconiensis]